MKHPQPSAAVLTAWIQGKNMLGPTSFSQRATLCEGLLVNSNNIFCQTKCFCFARYSTIPILQQSNSEANTGGSSSCRPQKTISRHRAIVRSTSCGLSRRGRAIRHLPTCHPLMTGSWCHGIGMKANLWEHMRNTVVSLKQSHKADTSSSRIKQFLFWFMAIHGELDAVVVSLQRAFLICWKAWSLKAQAAYKNEQNSWQMCWNHQLRYIVPTFKP